MSPHLLLVDTDTDLLRRLSKRLLATGYRVSTAGTAEAALSQLAIERPHLVISADKLPDRDGLALFDEICALHGALPVILLTDHGTIPDAVEATSRGVYDYLTKPLDSKRLLTKIAQALSLNMRPGVALGIDGSWRADIVSRANCMAELLAETRLVAASDASILIVGESGTGKELLAQAIHRASSRADAPFVAVNCGAIPEQLLESELFGHVRGAFTGAIAHHRGLFQTANNGTIFLDEIGDMPLPLQVKLLRVLQEKTVRAVGANEATPIDVRIVSATHRDLDAAMLANQFREDLYYRLNVVTLSLPSLAERREDIPLLASHFLHKLAGKYHKPINSFTADALELLATASWPGNVRQLYNVVEQVYALTTSPLIPLSLVQKALRLPTLEVLSYAEAKQRFERNYLIQILKLTGGQVADAARLANRNRTEFYRLLQKYQLTPGLFRSENGVVAD